MTLELIHIQPPREIATGVRTLAINEKDLLMIRHEPDSLRFIHAKLTEAGFDLSRSVTCWLDQKNRCYRFEQETT